ncbi:MAG: SprT family zinc-dependent metalloprotease [Peptoniphilaceae bacterium]|nr:SprT family zinc-dependent metalloprotease [Peptoniphilaceae bacterium]MDY6018541.1 SprT family zinc-dependent metalloprotease [Anaerococcus sp.]
MKRKYIQVQGLKVRLDKRKNYKNIRIRVLPPYGKVVASSPEYISDKMIKGLIKKNIKSIKKTINQQVDLFKDKIQSYEDGKDIQIFGKEYRIEVLESEKNSILLEDNKLMLMIKDKNDKNLIEKKIDKFLRDLLKEKARIFLKKYQDQMGLSINGFTIRKMKTKRGTCNITKKRISLNFELVKYDIECLEYIVVHELVHLLEKGHTKDFYRLVERYLPKYKKIEEFLDKQIIIS